MLTRGLVLNNSINITIRVLHQYLTTVPQCGDRSNTHVLTMFRTEQCATSWVCTGSHRRLPWLVIRAGYPEGIAAGYQWYDTGILRFDDERITKLAFIMDLERGHNNWCSDLKVILDTLELSSYYTNKQTVNVKRATDKMYVHYASVWKDDVVKFPKLRAYRLFKSTFQCETYLLLNLPKNERSLLAQLRCGILPLRIETGRYVGEKPEERQCTLCNSGCIEDEKHFLLECPLYSVQRLTVFRELMTDIDFLASSKTDQLTTLINRFPRRLARFTTQAYLIRRRILFS